MFKNLKTQHIAKEKVIETVENLLPELVLTAHPTEVTRRSLVHKHVEINRCLSRLEHDDLTKAETGKLKRRLMQLIALHGTPMKSEPSAQHQWTKLNGAWRY